MVCPSYPGPVVASRYGMPPAVTLWQHPIHAVATEVGAVAVQAEMNKILKYSHLDSSYLFVPVAIKKCGSFGP